MEKKRALITGITGQDGSYLAELLVDKGYEVYGMHRISSAEGHLERIAHLNGKVHLISGDLMDPPSLTKTIELSRPDEVYNLGAQSRVGLSFDQRELTQEINWFGTKRLFEALEESKLKFRFYQASTSELFGDALEVPQNEKTPFNPQSPYADAKLEAHKFIQQKAEEGFFACAGILFNHESPRRGLDFVTRKITDGAARIKLELPQRETGKRYIELGNIDGKRDWGFAQEYVRAMWMMLQQKKPKNYVISTGETHSIREFASEAFDSLGMKLRWEGQGLNEVALVGDEPVIKINPQLYRPAEVYHLLGDSSRARSEIGWEQRVTFKELVKIMTEADLKKLKQNF